MIGAAHRRSAEFAAALVVWGHLLRDRGDRFEQGLKSVRSDRRPSPNRGGSVLGKYVQSEGNYA